MKAGTTVQVDIRECHDGYLKSEADGNQFSIAGEGSAGDVQKVRVVKKQGDTFIAITKGATLNLQIEEVVDKSTVRADPPYGPVFISAHVPSGGWCQCIVAEIHEDYITAKYRNFIPCKSDIPQGSPPDDRTQSLNNLIGQGKL